MEQDELQSLVNRLKFKPLPFDEREMVNRLAKRMGRPEVVRVVKKTDRVWKAIAVAASFALLLVTGWLAMELNKDSLPVFLETTAVADAKTKIVLSDGTIVWLNANATLRYPVAFDVSDDQRRVELAGEAFFEVSHDVSHPFIVVTDDLDIKVLGTSFEVDMCENYTDVSLLEGSVALFSHGTELESSDLVLSPGERARFVKSEKTLFKSAIRPEQTASWVTGHFVFRDSSLDEIMSELQRAFHVKIHIDNPYLSGMTFNADFTENETLDEILEVLRISARYTVERKKGEIHLR